MNTSEMIRDIANRLIALSYALEESDKADMIDLSISLDVLKQELNEV